MRDIKETFAHCFGDFETMFLDTDLNGWVIRSYYDEHDGDTLDGTAKYHVIVGYTQLPDDILLHLASAENVNSYDELEDSIQSHGLTFERMSTFINRHGFAIYPMDQFDEPCCENGDCAWCNDDYFECDGSYPDGCGDEACSHCKGLPNNVCDLEDENDDDYDCSDDCCSECAESTNCWAACEYANDENNCDDCLGRGFEVQIEETVELECEDPDNQYCNCLACQAVENCEQEDDDRYKGRQCDCPFCHFQRNINASASYEERLQSFLRLKDSRV